MNGPDARESRPSSNFSKPGPGSARAFALKHFATAVLVALACVLAREYVPFVTLAENWVADLRVARLTKPMPPHPRIAIVTINEDTLAEFPYRKPLDRRFFAELLRNLEAKGAELIGIDILFDQPTEPAKDAELQQTLRNLTIPVVVAQVDERIGVGERQLSYMRRYLEGVERAPVFLSKDGVDGKVRSIYLGEKQGENWVRGFAAKIAQVLGFPVPVQEVLPLAFYGNPNLDPPPFSTYPAHQIDLIPDRWIRGKIVLIGADLTLDDRHRTPFDFGYISGNGMPGILIHAHSLAQLLDGRETRVASMWLETAMILVFSACGAALAVFGASILGKTGLAVAISGLSWVGGFALYQHGGPLLPLVTPTLALASAGGFASVLQWRKERDQRQFIRNAFSKFVAPAVVKNLERNPERLTLSSERRVMTFLFTDVEGFTSMVEKIDLSILDPLLNAYLDEVCGIVLRHGGTIDKVVGDGLTVFFNAPVDQSDHASRAVACALEMDAACQSFAMRQSAQGVPFGRTRIGVHTGPAVVGNFGGTARFNYTAYGDAINTAARLESVNKHLGTRICVGGATVEECDQLHFRPVGRLVLKGKSEAIEAFEPVTTKEFTSSKHSAYLEAYSLMEQDDPGALDAFTAAAYDFPGDPLISFHARRLEASARERRRDLRVSGNKIVMDAK